MTPLMLALVSSFGIMCASLLGVIFTYGALGAWMTRNLTYLATFAGGVFTIVAYELVSESLHEAPLLSVAAAIATGAIVMELAYRIIPRGHHHHHAEHDHPHSALDGRRVLTSDALHNIGDGVLITLAFATDTTLGIVAAVGIFIHEFVQEVSEFFVLKSAGFSTSRALTYNFLISGTILVGVLLATLLTDSADLLLMLGALAAGAFLSFLARDIIPHAFRSVRRGEPALRHGVAAILGVSLMLVVGWFVPHTHLDEDHSVDPTAESVTG